MSKISWAGLNKFAYKKLSNNPELKRIMDKLSAEKKASPEMVVVSKLDVNEGEKIELKFKPDGESYEGVVEKDMNGNLYIATEEGPGYIDQAIEIKKIIREIEKKDDMKAPMDTMRDIEEKEMPPIAPEPVKKDIKKKAQTDIKVGDRVIVEYSPDNTDVGNIVSIDIDDNSAQVDFASGSDRVDLSKIKKASLNKKAMKQWKVVMIQDGKQLDETIELGEASDKNDVIQQLKRMGIGGEVISITQMASLNKKAQEEQESTWRDSEEIKNRTGISDGETIEYIQNQFAVFLEDYGDEYPELENAWNKFWEDKDSILNKYEESLKKVFGEKVDREAMIKIARNYAKDFMDERDLGEWNKLDSIYKMLDRKITKNENQNTERGMKWNHGIDYSQRDKLDKQRGGIVDKYMNSITNYFKQPREQAVEEVVARFNKKGEKPKPWGKVKEYKKKPAVQRVKQTKDNQPSSIPGGQNTNEFNQMNKLDADPSELSGHGNP